MNGFKGFFRGFAFLGFAILPFAILILMNSIWQREIRDIGCVGSAGQPGIERLFIESDRTVPGCEKLAEGRSRAELLRARDRKVSEWRAAKAGKGSSKATAARPAGVAVAQGRFEWMTFHLFALILFPAIALVSLGLMWRHLGRLRFAITAGASIALGFGWAAYSVWRKGDLAYDTASLLVPTRLYALSNFDRSFQESAWHDVRLDYGAGLIVTVLICFAASSVLADVGRRRRLTRARILAKRRGLKLAIAAASVLMTFLAFYLGEWLAWPARFALPANELGSYSGSAEEFRAYASGLRLYFGTGYTLALIGFAVPAVLSLPAPKARKAQPAKPPASAEPPPFPEPPPAEDEEPEDLLKQFVFSRAELGMLVSVLTPFVTTLASAAIQL
jgi:hypothetical protein